MKKILSLVAIAGLLVSTVPSSYAGNDPLYLNHKLDTMTINTEKLETLETTHMLSNAFSFLSKGVKTAFCLLRRGGNAVGKTCRKFFEKEDEFAEVNKLLLTIKTRKYDPCVEGQRLCEETMAICQKGLALCDKMQKDFDEMKAQCEAWNTRFASITYLK